MAEAAEQIEELYRHHIDRAVRLAYLLVGPGEAEDIAQDAFLRSAGKVSSLRNPDHFAAYLDRAVTLGSIDRHRSAARRDAREQRAERPPGGVGRVADQTVRVAERLDLLAALDQLSADQRAVVVLRFWLDYSERQIASLLRCRPGTVKSRLTRALTILKGVLDE